MKRITIFVLAIIISMVPMVTCGKCPDKCAHPKTDTECQDCAKWIASSSLTVGGKNLTFEQGVRPNWFKMEGQARCSIDLSGDYRNNNDDREKCRTVLKEMFSECVGYDSYHSGFEGVLMIDGPAMCEVGFKKVKV